MSEPCAAPGPQPQATSTKGYSGVDNLEVMEVATNYRRYLTHLVSSVAGPVEGRRLLDFGVGVGTHAEELRAIGYDVSCVETDDQLRADLESRGLRAVETVEELGDERFDVVYSLNVLEHIADDVGALQEWKRVLRLDGRLLIFVPAHRWLWSLQDEVSGHQRRYTTRTLRRAIDAAGLQIDRMTYVSTLLFPVIFVGRQWLKVLRRFREVTTENDLHPAWSNTLLRRIFRTEITLLRRVNLPFGASILCEASSPRRGRPPARRTGPASSGH